MGAGFYTGHACVLPMTGRPICWGANTYYQISSGGSGMPTPFALDAYYSEPSGIALGSDFTCVAYRRAAFGERVACQGTDGVGQLGDGSAGESSDAVPDDVMTAADGSTFLSSISLMVAGRAFVCGKLASGTVSCWGSNGNGAFGVASPGNRAWCDTATSVPGIP
jgi:hypothetical protein